MEAEWLEPDGRGGFASGTVGGWRTRRYHALLISMRPTGRLTLINGFEAWIRTSTGTFPISAQRYAGDVLYPDGSKFLRSFRREPWPIWTFEVSPNVQIEQQLFVPYGGNRVALAWRMLNEGETAELLVRPFISGRDYHGLMQYNSSFRFSASVHGEYVEWHPYEHVPAIAIHANGVYRHDPAWYRNFLYSHERDRGLDYSEDLAAPGEFSWILDRGTAVWMASVKSGDANDHGTVSAAERYREFRASERARRAAFTDPLFRAADAYVVNSEHRTTIIAGYPWFTDWGRDTFIAMRGLCLATGRLDIAEQILLAWSRCVSDGMLPNRFPDHGGKPEYNSVDASLWFVIVANELLSYAEQGGHHVERSRAKQLESAIGEILDGYAAGTRYGIRAAEDGLLAAGEQGVQLTWMDAKVGDWIVTPRIGKPVEIQALWLNALRIGARISDRWSSLLSRGLISFASRFWNEQRQCLFDVIDVDHKPGIVDDSVRPNQILAVGGLPVPLVDNECGRHIVDVVESKLWTPLGLRTLAPDDPRYVPHYQGNIRERDGAYHQGTAWPWLLGPFVEAWLRLNGATMTNIQQARQRFVAPLMRHLQHAGLGHVSEIADGDPPHTPRGCPFQAWSLSELLRLDMQILATTSENTSTSDQRDIL